MEVECRGLVSKQVHQVDLDLVTDISLDGWAGPLAVDAHEWPCESIRRSQNPRDIPVVSDDFAFRDGVVGVAWIWWEGARRSTG